MVEETNIQKNQRFKLTSFILIPTVLIFFVPLAYLLDLFDDWSLGKKIAHRFPIATIVGTIFVFFTSLACIIFNIENIEMDGHFFNTVTKDLSFYISTFILVWIIFGISKHVIYYSTLVSYFMSFIIVTLILSVILTQQSYSFDFADSDDDSVMDILKHIILVIPCLVSEGTKAIVDEITGLPSSTMILVCVILIFVISFFFVPFIISKMKQSRGIQLITEPKPLDNIILYLTQDSLKDKIINNRSYATRKLLEKNNELKTYLEENPIEGFNSQIHLLDKNINFENTYNMLDEEEKDIIKNTMKEDVTIDDFETILDVKMYIQSLLEGGVGDRYKSLLNAIKKYNEQKNKFIYQETSGLVDLINRTNNISDYNYHYAVSFWLYFDTGIQSPRKKNSKGLIFSYSNNPKIYYDYDTGNITATVRECVSKVDIQDKSKMNCGDVIVYESNAILFQRWNLFVVNFNYGTLDLFVNSNLVATKTGVSPYIESAFLQFGSDSDKMEWCGICSANYHDKPLNKGMIDEMYKTNYSPCQSK